MGTLWRLWLPSIPSRNSLSQKPISHDAATLLFGNVVGVWRPLVWILSLNAKAASHANDPQVENARLAYMQFGAAAAWARQGFSVLRHVPPPALPSPRTDGFRTFRTDRC